MAAGGDGTLNAVAQVTLGSGCEFGVIPQGTFNYFGRTHSIPSDATEATRALLTARVYPVQVGLVNGRVFLVNASLGLYRQSLEDREEQKQRFGRSRLVAAWAALGTILRGYRPMLIKLQREDEELELRTLTLFVGIIVCSSSRWARHAVVGMASSPPWCCAPCRRWRAGVAVRGAMGRLSQARGGTALRDELLVTPSNPRIRRSRFQLTARWH